MDTLLKNLEEPKFFDSFIQDNMKIHTYRALWKDEIAQVDYCAAKVYQADLAEYAAATVGSVIDKNAEKPTHQMPSLQELVGTIGRMGDEYQINNDLLDQYYYLEGRYRNNRPNYTAAQDTAEFEKLVQYLFRPFEKAVIAPHKRIDMLYFEGLFKGTQTVSRTNNTKANVAYTLDLGITTYNASTAAWGQTTATPLADIQAAVDAIGAKGKTVMKIRMSKGTFRKMCKATEIANAIRLDLGRVKVNSPLPIVAPDQMNAYLESVLLPTIVVEPDRWATLADGTGVNLTPDDRVVFQCAENVAVLKVAEPLELVDKLPNKTYSIYDDNLVGYWRDKNGRFTDYEMWAQPVFNGLNDFYILKTDQTA